MCSPKLKSVIIGSNGQQLAILGLSKLVVLLIKRVFHLSFKKPTIIDYMIGFKRRHFKSVSSSGFSLVRFLDAKEWCC